MGIRLILVSFLFAFILLGALKPLSAQQEIRGVVVDKTTGEFLPGVNILIDGTIRGTSTNTEGEFVLITESTDSLLIVSYIGYVTQRIKITDETIYFIQIEQDTSILDELVVIGYGLVRKRDVTGAIGRIGSEDIAKTTSLSADQSLQGKVAGVQITATSGAPGARSAVRIRGVGTFGNSSPIYVVDGVILDDISFLNPSDIASLEVLKDASATAIYGSRGANGVILVQTKKGSSLDDEPRIQVSLESGLQQLEKKIDLLDGREFAIITNEIRSGSYNNVDAVPNTDWQDLIFDIAQIHNHQISFSGGTMNSDYYMSLGYFLNEGIIERSNYERISLKLNNSYRIRENFKVGNNWTIAPYNQRNAPNVTFQAYRAQPLLKPKYDDGSFGVVYSVGNPLADLAHSNSYNNGVRLVGNVFAELYASQEWLVKTSFALDASKNKSKNFTPAFTVLNPDGTASQQNNDYSDLYKSEFSSYTWIWENTLNYIKEISDLHTISLLGGITMQQTRSEIIGLVGQNLIRDQKDFWYILPPYVVDEANNINMVNSIYNGVDPNLYYNMISFLGRLVYSYDNTYMTTITLRRDGSSKFAKDNQWGVFPSIAIGWNLDQEDFIHQTELISTLKLRASWGVIGNEKIAYFDRFSRVNSGLQAIFGSPDVSYIASTYGRLGNENLKWESTIQTDIGLEAQFFENRLSAEVDYYERRTEDILVELSTPGHLGNGQGQKIRYNAASITNKGIEFTLNWSDAINDLGYSINFLGNTIKNKVLAIGGSSGIDSTLIGGGLANGQRVTQSRIGLPIGAYYGYRTDGIFQNENELNSYPHLSQAGVGDLRFVDINNDGVINGDDRSYIGSPIPDFVYGFSVSLDYRGFDLSLNIQGQTGNEIFNGKNVVRPDPYNFEKHVWNRWTGEGTSNSEPRPSFGGYNYLPSDRFIHDGSYLRLKDLVIGYTIPEKIRQKINLDLFRVYIKANNFVTITKYTGYTPEIGSYDVLSNGIDQGIYPIPRIFSFGVNTSF